LTSEYPWIAGFESRDVGSINNAACALQSEATTCFPLENTPMRGRAEPGGGLLGTHLTYNYGQNNAKNDKCVAHSLLDEVQKVRLPDVETIQTSEQTGSTSLDTNSLVLSGMRQNLGPNLNKYVLTVDLTDINHGTKRANLETLDYFLNEHTTSIKRKLMCELTAEYYNAPKNYVFECSEFPLDVQDGFNSAVTAVQNSSLLTYSQNMFDSYLKNLKKYRRYIHITNGERSSFILLENRYSNSYRKKIKSRMDWLAHRYSKSGCVYVVLTLDPKKYGNDKVRMLKEHKSDFADFIDKVRRSFIRAGLQMPKYLHTVECMKEPRSRGNPHINVVFFGCRRLMDWRKILQYWGKGNIRINRTRDGQTVRNPVMYVCKYITKTYCETNDENIVTQSLVWLFNLKSFSCSRNLIIPLHPKGSGDWTADYLGICSPQETVFDDHDLITYRFGGGVGVEPPPVVVVNGC